jgi:glucosamine--fructose-6-phosphate aminotransferase (isomerizing)
MCNIAGYVGTEPAAPILLDLIERQEGLAGGYYTGLATVHEGTLHYRKVVGDLAHLRASTDAADLPGTIGIVHSRSNSGGDHEWSHPFVGCDDRLAYVANGSTGKWKDDPRLPAGAQRLADAGHVFKSAHEGAVGGYPMLRDGTCVHMSDVMAHAIGDALDASGDPEQAIRSAFLELPSEIVGLYVTVSEPDRIFGARWNLPMCAARDASGTYLASSPQAFARDVAQWIRIPPGSVFSVSADRLCLSPLGPPAAEITDDISRGLARQVILEALAGGDALAVGQMMERTTPLSAREELVVRYDPVYETLDELEREGLITRDIERSAGAGDGLSAPRFVYRAASGNRPAQA